MLIKTAFSGRFRLEVRNAYTHQLTKVREFNNTITNAGLDSYGNNVAGNLGRCWIGTGTTTPTINDTVLANSRAFANGAANNEQCSLLAPTEPNWTPSAKLKYRFEAGTATGEVSEVGISTRAEPTANNFILWSRALVTDAYDRPSSVTVLEDEYLDVFYILKLHTNLKDTSFTFNLGGETYNCVNRIAKAQDTRCLVAAGSTFGQLNFSSGISIKAIFNSNKLGTINESIKDYDQTSLINVTPSLSAYVNGTFYRDSVVIFDVNTGNLADGITGLELGPANTGQPQLILYNQISLDKPILKTKDNAIKFTLRSSWGRYSS